MDYEKCTTTVSDQRVVLSETSSRFELLNLKKLKIRKLLVDGCLLGSSSEKCDWILYVEKPDKKVLFVELKGCHIDKAISQLKTTVNKTQEFFIGYKRESYIVSSRCPKSDATMMRRKLEFQKITKSTLSIKNSSMQVCI